MKRLRGKGLLLAAMALLLLGAHENCEPTGPLTGTVYALTADSALTEGCFPPLTCVRVAISEFLGGTFRLELLAAGGLVDLYEVRDVFWLARFQGEDVPITGSGTYSDGLLQDRLRLKLRVGDWEPELFDSGLVPSGPLGSPEIDITVSINGQRFFDTVIDVRAVAFLPAAERTPCGPSGLTCDPDTEICVSRTPIGPAVVYGCEPIPVGCEEDRSCACAGAALCQGPFDVCTEIAENELQCECPMCQ